jgi:GGDEF domain-containing protein
MFDNEKYQKLYNIFESLNKELSLTEALKATKKLNPEAAKVLANHVYKDQMVPKMGNRFAFEDHLKRHKNTGFIVSADLNGLSELNKVHGHYAGDHAIKAAFNAMADVSRQMQGKAHRVGGDEARFHFTTPERAHAFMKESSKALDQLPKVPGTNHKVSVSMGAGFNHDHAEKALMLAKDKLGPLVNGKRQKINAPGQEPSVYHSLLHEPAPENWKPMVNKMEPSPHEQPPAMAPGNIKLHNPLKPKV